RSLDLVRPGPLACGGGATASPQRRGDFPTRLDAAHPLQPGRRLCRGEARPSPTRRLPGRLDRRRRPGRRGPRADQRAASHPARERLRASRPSRALCARRRRRSRVLLARACRLGEAVAERGDLARTQAHVSAVPAPPLRLASRSPQRRAILEQLAIPFEVVVPNYEEEPTGADPAAEVERHAQGKARSVAGGADDQPVLGIDTEVVLEGRVYGKPGGATEAEAMLEELSGRTHEVVSGLCLLTPAWEEVRHAVTRVSFRALTPRELGLYV